MRRSSLFLVFLPALFAAACSSSPSKSSVSVVVTPTTAQVNVGITAQFTATVTGSSNTAVTWEVNGVANGNSTVGTITAGGVYKAPATIPSPAGVTIAAVSQADSKASASASVTVLAAATVAVSPAAVTIATGVSKQFTATVTGTCSTSVVWYVNGIEGGNVSLGTITSNGLYTAPLVPPPSGSITITAVSVCDSTQSGSATVSIQFGVAAWKGQYAFFVKGDDANGALGRIGSITLDGEGNVTAGIEDVSNSTGYSTILVNSGTYSIGADGRGTLQLTNNTAGTVSFYLSVFSNTQGFLTETDGSAVATGMIYQQSSSSFAASGFSGSYVFGFAGVDASAYPESLIGRFTSDGAGNLKSGVLDDNDDSTNSGATSFTGASYQIDTTYGATYGRATASINGRSFTFYIVDGTRAEFLESDRPAVTVGEAVSQQTGLSGSTSDLSGNFVFVLNGATYKNATAEARGGRFSADGSGNITSIVLIDNDGGNAVAYPSSGTDTGKYTVDSSANGRGTLTFTDSKGGTYTFVFYLASTKQAVFQDTSNKVIATGSFQQQTVTSLAASDLAGSYAFQWGGISSGEEGFSGHLVLTSATSGNASGTMDYDDGGTSSSSVTFSGALTVSGDGLSRNNLSLTPTADSSTTYNFATFAVNANTVLLVGIDQKRVDAGFLRRQY